jgi:predicted CoA-binding protein
MIKKTLVLGASDNPRSYSFIAICRLKANGHPVNAVGKREAEVCGVKIVTTSRLLSGEMLENIDTITLYLNKKNQHHFYDYIVALQPTRVIFNPGTENVEFEKLLKQHRISYERACTLVLLSIGQY